MMSLRLVYVDRDTPMLLPPDLRDWVPQRHIVHLILDSVDRLGQQRFHLNRRGSGSEQYPPEMMLALLIYCYCTRRFSSRRIEEATYSDVVVRYIYGNTHPDHDTVCTFRRQNRELFEEAFVEVLLMAKGTQCIKKVGTVSIDGTKIKANASKHCAVSYKRAGKKPRGRKPEPPLDGPPGNKQYNFTDPQSHIMKEDGAFVQAYNAQAVVDTESRLIIGKRVSNEPNDKKELVADVRSIAPVCGKPDAVLADSGYYSEDGIEEVETDGGPTAYVAVEKSDHGCRVEDLEAKDDPPAATANASGTDKMRQRLATEAGKEFYKLRKQTVEPVFGIIKEVLWFRRFSMRGRQKVNSEWSLVCLAYNMRRLFILQRNCAVNTPLAAAGG